MDEGIIERAFLELAAEPAVLKMASLLVKSHRGGYRVLTMLERAEEPLTPSQLALSCDVSTARMTVILNSLQLKGYLKKHRKRSDKRSLSVSLTPKGRDVLREYQSSLRSSVAKIVSRLDEKELRHALSICGKIVGQKPEGESGC